MSIQEAAEAVVEAMDFHGEVTVSFGRRLGCLEPPCRRLCPDAPMALTLAAGGVGGTAALPWRLLLGKLGQAQEQAGGGGASPRAEALTRCPV